MNDYEELNKKPTIFYDNFLSILFFVREEVIRKYG